MNWEAIGAIGEIIAAAAVVISLIYLAAQIGHNTRQVHEQNRSQRQVSLNEVARRFTDFRRLIITSREVASIWLTGRSNLADLDPRERSQFDFLMVEMFWAWGILFLYRQQGIIDGAVVDLSLENLNKYASSPGIEEWWLTSKYRTEYPDDFIEYVDDFYARMKAPDEP